MNPSRESQLGLGARRFAAIALVSGAVILLQITVTRILSVVLWYHWAFFSISLAMLGVGAPGVWFSFVRPGARHLRYALLLSSLTIPLGIVAVVRGAGAFGDWAIVSCMVALLPALLCLGSAVCLLLLDAPGPEIGKMYAFDLVGACVGALAVVPLMWLVPTPELAAGIGMLPLAALVLLWPSAWPSGAAVFAGLACLFWAEEPLRVQSLKSYVEDGTRQPIYERWTPTGRIAVFDHIFFARDPSAGFGWGFGSRAPTAPPVDQYWIEQDGAAGTPITRLTDAGPSELSYLMYDVTTVGYQVRRPRRVAIVGSGGGRDVLSARIAGATEIDAIELNPAIVEAVNERFGDFSGAPYTLPGVRPVIGEGRSALTRSSGDYDLIQISLTDSWAATSAGAYALSESNLYTIEAYRLYWSRLSSDGLVSTSRWMRTRFGIELPRLLFLVHAALQAEGVRDPSNHIAVFQGDRIGTVLMSRAAWSGDELATMRSVAQQRGFTLHLPERFPPGPPWLELLLERGHLPFLEQGVRLTPPTDDRPFFFQVLSPFSRLSREAVEGGGINNEGVLALQRLMWITALLALLLFLSPFVITRRLVRGPRFWTGSVYFLSIGLAFMLVEVSWVQRLILYLGHPSLATAAGLGCILLGAGLGSLSAARLGVDWGWRIGFLLPVLVAGVNALLAPIFESTLGWHGPARLALTCAAIVPPSFLMGFAFPLGMLAFGDLNKAWYWAINGAAGVLASVASLALAMEIGFRQVAWLGGAFYGVAWLLLRGARARN